MSNVMYRCPVNSAHAPTDQRNWIGCRQCWVEQQATSTSFFTTKHVWQPGDPIRQRVSAFTYHPSNYSLTIDSTGETVRLDSASGFIDYWTDPAGGGKLYWNTKHRSANWLTPQVGYGETGSWSTSTAGKFTSNVKGILVAKVFGDDAHAMPVNPEPIAVCLTEWPWRCACGGLAPQGQSQCVVCQASSAAPTVRLTVTGLPLTVGSSTSKKPKR